MKILVCGGRTFSDWALLSDSLDVIRSKHEIDEVIHGAAPGADTLADTWARSRGIPVRRFIARWMTEGRAAGPLRNARMLAEGKPDVVIAFPGGKGTADMKERAFQAGIEVVEIIGAA